MGLLKILFGNKLNKRVVTEEEFGKYNGEMYKVIKAFSHPFKDQTFEEYIEYLIDTKGDEYVKKVLVMLKINAKKINTIIGKVSQVYDNRKLK